MKQRAVTGAEIQFIRLKAITKTSLFLYGQPIIFVLELEMNKYRSNKLNVAEYIYALQPC